MKYRCYGTKDRCCVYFLVEIRVYSTQITRFKFNFATEEQLRVTHAQVHSNESNGLDLKPQMNEKYMNEKQKYNNVINP